MLYVFFGPNAAQNIERARACISGLLKKEPYASQIQITEENFPSVHIGDILSTSGLFKDKLIITLSNLFSSEHAEALHDHVKEFAASEHVVVVIDRDLKAAEKNLLKKHAHTTIESKPKEVSEAKHNPFVLADALYAKDGKALFVRIEEARLRGDEVEAVVGLLSWAAKAMLLAQTSQSAAATGLKPFVYSKAKEGSKQWGSTVAPLVRMTAHILHDSRRNGKNGYDELLRNILVLCA